MLVEVTSALFFVMPTFVFLCCNFIFPRWHTQDVKPDPDKDADFVACFIHSLKPFTKYALYVQTYTIATASQGALSKIYYFRTEPDGLIAQCTSLR
jgi:hypothetical protein